MLCLDLPVLLNDNALLSALQSAVTDLRTVVQLPCLRLLRRVGVYVVRYPWMVEYLFTTLDDSAADVRDAAREVLTALPSPAYDPAAAPSLVVQCAARALRGSRDTVLLQLCRVLQSWPVEAVTCPAIVDAIAQRCSERCAESGSSYHRATPRRRRRHYNRLPHRVPHHPPHAAVVCRVCCRPVLQRNSTAGSGRPDPSYRHRWSSSSSAASRGSCLVGLRSQRKSRRPCPGT